MATAHLRELTSTLPTDQEAQQAKESSRLLAACIGRGHNARIKVYSGNQEIEVPVTALRMLVEVLAQMADGNAVTIVPTHAILTTQQAADVLNVSRPYLIGLLARGAIPFEKVGSHRRLKFLDLMKYREQQRQEREQAMDALVAQAQEQNLGY